MSRSMKSVLSALGITLVLLNLEAHSAEHHGKEAHASPAPSAGPAAHSSGGAHPSFSAPSHNGGNSSPSSSGPSGNAGTPFSHPSAINHNTSSVPVFSSAPVHQGTFFRSTPSVPFSNTAPSLPHLGNNAPRLNVSTPANAALKIDAVRHPSITNQVQIPNNLNLHSRFNRSEPIHTQTQSPLPVQANNRLVPTPNIASERSFLREHGGATNRIQIDGRFSQSVVPHVETPTTPSNLAKNVHVQNSDVASGHSSHPEDVTLPGKHGIANHNDVLNNNSHSTVGDPVQRGPASNATRVENLRRTHDGNLRFGSLPAPVTTPHDQKFGSEGGRHLASTTERLKAGHLEHLVNSDIARQVDLKKQFQLHEHGDLARRLKLADDLQRHGGWHERLAGPISPVYTKHAFGHFYAGPGCYPHYCWCPHWSPWVNWCWNFTCPPYYDPRPIFCQPIVYAPCQPWTGWSYPVWCGLPMVSCGTWVDIPVVTVPVGIDVQLLAVRFVDPGHPEKGMGPRYRVWFRNNSSVPIEQPFDLVIYASNEQLPGMGLPETGVRVSGMDAGQTQAVDLRLPYAADILDRDPQGRKIPFRYLHVIADSHQELADVDPANNGAVLNRLEILSVDPAVFSASLDNAAGGLVIDIAGEGLGPEAGQVVVQIVGQELTPEILGWCDMGVQVRLPNLPFNETTKAEILVIRGDRAASNPLPVKIPAERTPEVAPNPVP